MAYDVHTHSDLVLLLSAMGLNSLPLGYTLVVLLIYLNELGYSGDLIGIITMAAAASNTIMTVPFAIAADRYGTSLRMHVSTSGIALKKDQYLLDWELELLSVLCIEFP